MYTKLCFGISLAREKLSEGCDGTAGHLERYRASDADHRVRNEQRDGVQAARVQQRHAGNEQMACHHVADVIVILHIASIEEDDAPEGVQQDHGERLGGTDQHEDVRGRLQPHRCRSDRVRQNVDQGKCSTDDAKAQPGSVRKNVSIVGNAHDVRHLLQATFRLAEYLVHQVAESFLKEATTKRKDR